ncbi:signal recognition particle-docking protein FtsY [Lapidilactobacillus mulanensis]|uniref:Signal recognition particle receptor FtsY n=1 Tax=Lapidilactobacillus mulanensis TaxID=2485999 RepID=A0ABW4DLJ7_9LACO|nr:signal recognition particle-docking protein FtsY [Lapidilactobacillus mulanensis]
MGFFDRVKKAFGAKPKADEEKQSEEAELKQEAVLDSEGSETSEQAEKMSENSTVEDSEDVTEQQESEAFTENDLEAVEVESESTTTPDSEQEATHAEQSVVQSEEISSEDRVETSDDNEQAPTDPIVDETSKVASTDQATDSTSESSVEVDEDLTEAQEPDEDSSEPLDSDADESDSVAEYDQGLAKSRTGFTARLNKFLANFRSVDEDFFEDLEEMLIEADVGFDTAMTISNQLREEVKLKNAKTKKQVGQVIVEKMVDIYGEAGEQEDNTLHFAEAGEPTVYLFVGVNGAGKTTTIGKLAAKYHDEGKSVLLAAGDTFRAGAIEQLAEWARRTKTDIVTSKAGADPASVIFEAAKKAHAENYDILLVDTAGRLQNNVNLMNELAKIKRVIVRELPNAPQEVLLVLDASTGQNALNQAKQFSKTTDVTGLILTKLDGSSKGGIVIAIRNELHLPVKLVGLGEKTADLQLFDPAKYVYGLFKDLIED